MFGQGAIEAAQSRVRREAHPFRYGTCASGPWRSRIPARHLWLGVVIGLRSV